MTSGVDLESRDTEAIERNAEISININKKTGLSKIKLKVL